MHRHRHIDMNTAFIWFAKKTSFHPGLFYLLDILVGDVVRLNGGQWSEHVSLGTREIPRLQGRACPFILG